MNKPKLTNPKTKLATLQVVYLVFSPNLRHTMSDTVHDAILTQYWVKTYACYAAACIETSLPLLTVRYRYQSEEYQVKYALCKESHQNYID